jgi:hypothetical protein
MSIEWTLHRQPAAIQDMRVHHGGFRIVVPEEFVDRPDIISLLQQRRGKTVSEGLATEAFGGNLYGTYYAINEAKSDSAHHA